MNIHIPATQFKNHRVPKAYTYLPVDSLITSLFHRWNYVFEFYVYHSIACKNSFTTFLHNQFIVMFCFFELYKHLRLHIIFCFFHSTMFFFNWGLITLQYCSGFCHTLTWISHGCTCVLNAAYYSFGISLVICTAV